MYFVNAESVEVLEDIVLQPTASIIIEGCNSTAVTAGRTAISLYPVLTALQSVHVSIAL
jgi:hypothetical protein